MKKKFAYLGVLVFLLLIFLSAYVIKNNDPYKLLINKEYIQYENFDYENGYVVDYGEIKQEINTECEINISPIIKKNVTEELYNILYVGEVIKDARKESIDIEADVIRIIAKEKNDKEFVITYLKNRKINVDLRIEEKFLEKITEKNEMNFLINNIEYDYDVIEIGNRVIDGYFVMKVGLYDDEAFLREGMRVDANIVVEEKKDVLRIPVECVTKDGGGTEFVYLKANDSYEVKNIKTGISDGRFIEVKNESLRQGDIVLAD